VWRGEVVSLYVIIMGNVITNITKDFFDYFLHQEILQLMLGMLSLIKYLIHTLKL
jgi:hypothetical protein